MMNSPNLTKADPIHDVAKTPTNIRRHCKNYEIQFTSIMPCQTEASAQHHCGTISDIVLSVDCTLSGFELRNVPVAKIKSMDVTNPKPKT